MIKSPYNWVGNKYKYINIINDLISNKYYDYVIDLFMGSGNILFNINNCNNYIGNDIIKLLPNIYDKLSINNYQYTINDFNNIINKYNNISNKLDYYNFRKYWNNKYINNIFDKLFILETIILLKMCSNSMVRFNSHGLFNQGFRNIDKNKKCFFSELTKTNIINQINSFSKYIDNKYRFLNLDYINIKNNYKNSLYIIDPPYQLCNGFYNCNFSNKHVNYLYNLLDNIIYTNNKFIYFNYLQKDNIINNQLNEYINSHKQLNLIKINNKTKSGQNRINTKIVNEILLTNII